MERVRELSLGCCDMTKAPISWDEVVANLESSRNYWISTTCADGSPHATPVWGVFIEGVPHFYSERTALKAKNLALRSNIVFHSESGDEVTIVNGVVDDLGDPSDTPDVVSAFVAKYNEPGDADYLPVPDSGYAIFAVRAVTALNWSLEDFDGSQRRWTSI